ncbi:hypothetical protein [Hymenobacter cellulosivorans]|uniref:Uncharacterized protein n=1 Tax=Hymenobacter cellulosivorans TaxID=2932249 RepID=A0ABY4FAM4_9BACT|nr:hypothetical protein [Hymenobacter cellulosivorans]UOQ53072.1 hypothetical protein MUN80_25460 [Hymenobacter cellulosivorans]
MAKQPTKPSPTAPPGYAVATGVPGRVVFTNVPPEVIADLHRLAKHHGIRCLNLTITAQDLDE